MGSGGSTSLWSPDKLVELQRLLIGAYRMLSGGRPSGGALSSNKKIDLLILGNNKLDGISLTLCPACIAHNHLCYMVKPHGQLVLVSSTRHRAYTPSLSTS